jgi:hypothetical protein
VTDFAYASPIKSHAMYCVGWILKPQAGKYHTAPAYQLRGQYI